MFNPMELMGKLREMQAEMERVKLRLDDITIISETGGGMVKVTANANRRLLKIEVDPDIVDKNDKEFMEDLIVAAVNKAMEDADARAKDEISKVSAGIMPNIPGMDLSKFGK
jgi:nucleoid-associated protein EbfC